MEYDAVTVPRVPPRPRPVHFLDHRGGLLPRDYLADPPRFGTTHDARWRVPPGGDLRALHVAYVCHLVAVGVRARGDRDLARRLQAGFGFSKQVWSRCLLGQAWMGETVLAAAVYGLLRLAPPGMDQQR